VKNLTLFLFFILFSIPLNSFGQSVTADFDSKTDFKKFKTYAWLAPGDSVLNRYRADKLFGGTILYYANHELTSRGFKMDTLKPDAIFIFGTQVEEITKYSQSATLSVGVGVAGPGYYVAGSTPVAGGKITASTVEEGVLSYSMYDTQTAKLVWAAHIEKSFKMSDDLQKIIGNSTEKIFKKLPMKKIK